MGGVEAAGELAEDRDRPLRRERAVGHHPPEVGAVDELHRHVEPPVLLTGVVDDDDRRVLDRCGEPRFAPEAGDVGLVAGQLRGEDLQGPRPVEGDVAGAIDDAHPAATDLLLDQVPRKLGSLHGWSLVRPRHETGPAIAGPVAVGVSPVQLLSGWGTIRM